MITVNSISNSIANPVFGIEKKSLMGYQRQRLLVIEGHPLLQKLVSRTLTEQAFEIRFASNGLEGLALFSEHDPNLTIFNLRLQGSGWHVRPELHWATR